VPAQDMCFPCAARDKGCTVLRTHAVLQPLTNDSKATVSVLYWYGNYPTLSHLALTFWNLAGRLRQASLFIRND